MGRRQRTQGQVGPRSGGATRAHGWVPAVAAALAALAVLAPTLGPGYVLSYDMVFIPRLPLAGDLLGLGSQTPRAVPSDLLVAGLSRIVSGQLVQKAILLVVVFGGGLGAARLVPRRGIAATAAALAYIWTPYLGERLLIGQWAALIGWAALPWLVGGALAVRAGADRAWRELALATVLCAAGGATTWVMAAVCAPLIVAWPMRVAVARETVAVIARLGAVLSLLLVLALPWLVPSVLRPGRMPADVAAARVFAVHSDTSLGPVASLLTGGGIWNHDVLPAGRTGPIHEVVALLLLAMCGWGLLRLRSWSGLGPLVLVGVASLSIGLISLVPALRNGLAHLPAGGLLRDAQRYLPGWSLLMAVGFAAAAQDLRVRTARSPWAGAAMLIVFLPVVSLPTLAWGVGGRLEPVRYPADYAAVSRMIDVDPRPGAVLVLPWSAYRSYGWNEDRVGLDPFPRWVGRTVVFSSDLPVGQGSGAVVVVGDDPFAARVHARLAQSGTNGVGLLGVRWVVLDAASAGVDVSGLLPIFRGTDLSLFEVRVVGQPVALNPSAGFTAPHHIVLAADVVTGALAAAVLTEAAGFWSYRLVTFARMRRRLHLLD